ncbi:MAG: hypothetical protein L6Q76_26455 [Polyangiaceae bacterium]|nr:hypothetical protein [Polyangiaceae bacterium]
MAIDIAVPYALLGLLAEPITGSLFLVERGLGRPGGEPESDAQVLDLSKHRFALVVAPVVTSQAGPEMTCNPVEAIELRNSELEKPPIPVTEGDAVNFTPRLRAVAHSIIEWALGRIPRPLGPRAALRHCLISFSRCHCAKNLGVVLVASHRREPLRECRGCALTDRKVTHVNGQIKRFARARTSEARSTVFF